jgi:hypothetical protein
MASRGRGREGRVTWAAVVLAGLLGSGAACGETQVIGNGDDDVDEDDTCAAFVPGTNMLEEDWGGAAGDDEQLAATMQSAGDLQAAGAVLRREIAHACDAMAQAGGAAPTPFAAQPRRDQQKAACTLAAQELAQMLTETGVLLTLGPATGCDLDGAEAQCRAGCAGEETCDAYCASSAAATADCPPVPITVEGEVPEAHVAEVTAMASALGRFLGVSQRYSLLSDLVVAVTGQMNADTLSSLPSACIPVVVEALESAATEVEAAVSADGAITAAMDG